MLLFVGAGSKQSVENWCMRRCDCNLSLKKFVHKEIISALIILSLILSITDRQSSCIMNAMYLTLIPNIQAKYPVPRYIPSLKCFFRYLETNILPKGLSKMSYENRRVYRVRQPLKQFIS